MEATPTARLWDCVVPPEPECLERPLLPGSFIEGLRAALETGMSCEQITAMLFVMAGLYEMMDRFDPDELVGRSVEIVRVMKGDLSR